MLNGWTSRIKNCNLWRTTKIYLYKLKLDVKIFADVLIAYQRQIEDKSSEIICVWHGLQVNMTLKMKILSLNKDLINEICVEKSVVDWFR